jgi:hypothetical protein
MDFKQWAEKNPSKWLHLASSSRCKSTKKSIKKEMMLCKKKNQRVEEFTKIKKYVGK